MKTQLSFFLLILIGLSLKAQTPSESELLKAINECTDYTTNVLLDADGKSRCDYNLIEGKWYPYEEPWHTGQVILGYLQFGLRINLK